MLSNYPMQQTAASRPLLIGTDVGQTECAPLRKSLTWQLLMLPWLIEDSVGQDAHTSGRGGTATIGSGAISTSGEPRSDYRSVWSSSMFEMLGLIFQEGFLA